MGEVDSAALEAACERYVSLVGDEDVDSLMDLFAPDCRVEDPVGSPVREGHDAVREFYATLPAAGVSARLCGPVHTVPDARAAAFPFEIDTAGMVMQVIDVMTFDEEGKITSMTAYWNM
ncbi:MAG: nuclear transport factor 2 family protein [Microthrixaceae bacterium]|nr:nuclear transport factor 2 family protein [Microthrixaceae bacterium]